MCTKVMGTTDLISQFVILVDTWEGQLQIFTTPAPSRKTHFCQGAGVRQWLELTLQGVRQRPDLELTPSHL